MYSKLWKLFNLLGIRRKSKLDLVDRDMRIISTGEIPRNYIFNMATEMPVFLIDDHLYYLSEEKNKSLASNFFQVSKRRKYALLESASLVSLEELTVRHEAEKIDTLEKRYSKALSKQNQQKLNIREYNYKLINFILTEVFPYFRTTNNTTNDDNGEDGSQVLDEEKTLDAIASNLISKVKKEKFNNDVEKGKVTKSTKLEELLEDEKKIINHGDYVDYEPSSVFGRVVHGRNIAIIDEIAYNLEKDEERSLYEFLYKLQKRKKLVLNLDGKTYTVGYQIDISKVMKKYYFEVYKQVRLDALRKNLHQDKTLRDLIRNNEKFEDILKKREYSEDGMGFVLNDETYPDYFVSLNIPAHVLKMPDIERYYYFTSAKVAVKIYINRQGEVAYDTPPIILGNKFYEHPYIMDSNKICLGRYSYDNRLKGLNRGEAIAKLLLDAKNTLVFGYFNEDNKNSRETLKQFENHRISYNEIVKRNLPITNSKIEKKSGE